ncbi:MAG TPA: cytochrome c [Polyangia bacterium]|nr:cytochrome c [Polyangia bacterium]
MKVAVPGEMTMTVSRKNSAFEGNSAFGKTEIDVVDCQQGTPSLPTSPGVGCWRRTTLARSLRVTFAFAALAFCALWSGRASATVDAKKVFNQRCTACHTFGKGVKVGPDLKGVTARRQRPWLQQFIRGSSKVIASGDPVATELFRTYKKQRMPDWSDLSPQDVATILDWLAADGPDQKPADERDAELASAADVARARGLFDGSLTLASGGMACGACHAIRDQGRRTGGTLGPELTDAYLKFRDRALTLYLRHPCTPRQPEVDSGRYLEPSEAFAIKAYLREAALAASPFTTYPITEAKRGHP